MSDAPLMPMATAVWLVENTTLTFKQIANFCHLHEVEMTRRYRKNHDLMGMEADDLITVFDTLKEEDIWQFRYPDDIDLSPEDFRQKVNT